MVWDRPDIEAIKARVEAATPGPWRRDGELSGVWADAFETHPEYGAVTRSRSMAKWTKSVYLTDTDDRGMHRYEAMESNDADFIAHARQDIPALLEYIAFLERFIDDQTGL